jgi:Uri superfamily endonuclease
MTDPSTLIPSTPGSYVLVLAATQATTIRVGRLRGMAVTPGWYLYVGSALGVGGLAGRLHHHARPVARPHWHVDYVRAVTALTAVWWLASPERLEHRWALALAELPGSTIPMARFGASDCRCPAHLLYLPALPAPAALADLLSPSPSARPTLSPLTGA